MNKICKNILSGILVAAFLISLTGCATEEDDADFSSNNGLAADDFRVANKIETKDPDFEVKIIWKGYSVSNRGYSVEGYVKNNLGDFTYVSIMFPVYDKDGNKIGDVHTNCGGLKKFETWKFEASMAGGKEGTSIGEAVISHS